VNAPLWAVNIPVASLNFFWDNLNVPKTLLNISPTDKFSHVIAQGCEMMQGCAYWGDYETYNWKTQKVILLNKKLTFMRCGG